MADVRRVRAAKGTYGLAAERLGFQRASPLAAGGKTAARRQGKSPTVCIVPPSRFRHHGGLQPTCTEARKAARWEFRRDSAGQRPEECPRTKSCAVTHDFLQMADVWRVRAAKGTYGFAAERLGFQRASPLAAGGAEEEARESCFFLEFCLAKLLPPRRHPRPQAEKKPDGLYRPTFPLPSSRRSSTDVHGSEESSAA